jgi:hypothetical protein
VLKVAEAVTCSYFLQSFLVALEQATAGSTPHDCGKFVVAAVLPKGAQVVPVEFEQQQEYVATALSPLRFGAAFTA